MDLADFARDFADGIKAVDARAPVAINQRSKAAFAAGIGPHSESATVDLVMAHLAAIRPDRYSAFVCSVRCPNAPRQKCDLCLGVDPDWQWAIEIKLLRLLGDNGQPNDNMLMHILSPYPAHRSALTDCTKLLGSGLRGRKAVVIYGYESAAWPLAPAIKAFEALARSMYSVGQRVEGRFAELIHPIHKSGMVYGWELHSEAGSP